MVKRITITLVSILFTLVTLAAIGHAIAPTGPAVVIVPMSACQPDPAALFNPCAVLNTTQVQDRRTDADKAREHADNYASCVMDPETDEWIALPCVYTFDDGRTVFIDRQP